MFMLNKTTLAVDESLRLEFSRFFKNVGVVHDMIQIWKDHGVLWKMVFSVCGLHVFSDPVRYAEAYDGSKTRDLVYHCFRVGKVFPVVETWQPINTRIEIWNYGGVILLVNLYDDNLTCHFRTLTESHPGLFSEFVDT